MFRPALQACSIAAAIAIAVMAPAADPVPAAGGVAGDAAAAAGAPAPAALDVLPPAECGPSLGERFGLPRPGGPLQLGLPPIVSGPILAVPPAAKQRAQRVRERVAR